MIFSNRELASATILIIYISFCLRNREVRKSITRFFKVLSTKYILLSILTLSLYVAGEVWLLNTVGLWNLCLLKDTCLWFIFSAMALFMEKVNSAAKNGMDIKKLLRNTLSGLILLEYLIANYSFSFITELLLGIIGALFAIIVAIGTPKIDPILVKFSKNSMICIGFALIIHSCIGAYNDPSILTIETLRQILAPIALTILFIPILYLFSLISIYSTMHFTVECVLKNDLELGKYIKLKALKIGNINLNKVRRLSKIICTKICFVKTREDVDRILATFNKTTSIRLKDKVEISTTGEVGEVDSLTVDFAKIRIQDELEEVWVWDLKTIKND